MKTELAAKKAAQESKRATWESERTAFLAQQSQLQQVATEERELGEIVEMMQIALEI